MSVFVQGHWKGCEIIKPCRVPLDAVTTHASGVFVIRRNCLTVSFKQKVSFIGYSLMVDCFEVDWLNEMIVWLRFM